MKTFIAIPCMSQMDTQFVESLCNLNKGMASVNFNESSLVYDSRDTLATHAIESESDYILWLDSDMVFNADLLIDLMKTMKDKKADMVCALYCARRPNFEPCVWTKLRISNNPEENQIERLKEIPTEPFEIDGCGFGAVLMKTEIADAVKKSTHFMFSPLLGFGEDLSFCIRAKRLGASIWCDPRIKIGHLTKTQVTTETFENWRRNMENNNGNP